MSLRFRLAVLALLLVSTPPQAHASSTRFYCTTEEAAEQAAESASMSNTEGGHTMVALMKAHTCFYLRSPVQTTVVRKGKVFTNSRTFTVVAFTIAGQDGLSDEMYGFVLGEKVPDDTI